MKQCELSVELEDEKRRYRPGETMRGTVRLRTPFGLDCRRLLIGHHWRTQGLENDLARESSDLGHVTEIFSGKCEPGADLRVPFAVKAPPGPLTYRGSSFEVAWLLRARAEVFLTPDFVADEGFELDRWLPGESDLRDAGYRAAPRTSDEPYVFGVLGARVRRFVAKSTGNVPFRNAARWFVAFLGKLISLLLLRGGPHLEIPTTVAAGDRIEARISLPRRARGRVRELEVRLNACEAVGVSGYLAIDYAHLDIADAEPTATDPDTWTASFDVPTDAPPSFDAWHAQLGWSIAVRCKVRGVPTWVTERTLVVAPPRMPSESIVDEQPIHLPTNDDRISEADSGGGLSARA